VRNGTGGDSGGGYSSSSGEGDASDGREKLEYTFVDEVPGECLCGLCGELMDEPLQTQCCRKDYCQPCMKPPPSQVNGRHIKNTAPSGVDCPDCQSPNVKLQLNLKLKKKVEGLQVKCVYASAGCVWEGERAWLKEHGEGNGGCGYAPVLCGACSAELRKKDELSHATSHCKMRNVKCQYCSTEDTHEVITTHHHQECPNYPVVCTLNCGETVPRCKLQDHLDQACKSKGLRCPYRSVGCAAPLIPEADMEAHVASCGVSHLLHMFQKFTSEIEELRNEVRDLRKENQTLRQEVKSATTAMETTTKALDTLKTKSDRLNQTLLSELEYCYAARQPTEMIAVECIKTQLASGLIHLQPGGFPAMIRMTSYSMHKESGKVWLSPPFYIHAGYKLRLGVHVNGVGAGKGSHMSVYLHQMAGERDHQLDWPYVLKDWVKVSLIKQTEHHTPKDSPAGTATPTTLGRGSPRFFGRKTQQLSTSPDAHLTISLPPSAAPLRQKRRMVDELRTPPKDCETQLVTTETQSMPITSYLRRMPADTVVGAVVSKVELFCIRAMVEEAVYRDSLVFQCGLCSSNLKDGHIAC
jgi:hypothetical protein